MSGFLGDMQTSRTTRKWFLLRTDVPKIALGSYSLSTGCQPNALGQYISSSVQVSVMDCAAITCPDTNVERERIQNPTTIAAEFSAGKEGVDFDQLPSVPRGFIFKHTNEFSPTRIGNAACQRAIANHITNFQRFDGNQLIFLNEPSAEFVEPIRTNVRNLLMNLSDSKSSLDAIPRAIFTASQSLLSTFQLFPCSNKRLGSYESLCIRSHGEIREPQVNSNRAHSNRLHFEWSIDAQANVVSSRGSFTNVNCGW